MTMDLATLTHVVSKSLGRPIRDVDHQITQLQGGTLGDVKLVAGRARTTDGIELPYRLVWKTQKRWERPGDPDSWRREYDLYRSGFGAIFSEALRWPTCHRAEMNGDEIQLWMEYIDGASGANLTVDLLADAATELGRFQGRLYRSPAMLRQMTCLSDAGFMEREHNQWHTQTLTYEFLCSEQCRVPDHVRRMIRNNPWNGPKTIEHHYLRSRECDIPECLKQMLIDVDDNRGAIFQKIGQLPVVLCHRDFWIENIFWVDGQVVLIDWDGAGFGYMGEDIASLIADDTENDRLLDYYNRLIPAYFKGLSESIDADVLPIQHPMIWEMIVIKFGYRVLQDYMFTTSDDVKYASVERLQKIHAIQQAMR